MKAFLLLILLLAFSSAEAATYYVRTDGHDTNCNGTADAAEAAAPNCAWLTIGKAETSVSGTNTIIVGNGSYTENLTIDASGTDASNLLTFRAQNNRLAIITGTVVISGNYVKFDGFKVLKPDSVEKTISMTGTYITTTNCYFDLKPSWTPYAQTDVHVAMSGSHNTATNNYITHGCQGAGVGGSYNTFSNNEIDHPTLIYNGNCGDIDFVRVFGDHHVFSGNYFHGLVPEENGAAHTDAFQSFDNAGQTISDTLFENNIMTLVENSCWILSMTYNKSAANTGIVIRNNVCYSSTNYCADLKYVSFEFYNNTCVILHAGYGIEVAADGDHTGKVKNNIFIALDDESVSPVPYSCKNATQGTDCKNNILWAPNFITRYDGETYVGDTVNTDPLLTNIAGGVFTLQSGSPARTGGVDLSATGFSTDVRGVARPQGATWSRGAYEYYEQGSIHGVTSMGVSKK